MNVAIIGTGAYGIALALVCHDNKCNVKMWTKFIDEKEAIESNRMNMKVLPDVRIPEEIEITNSLEEAISNSDLILIAIPAAFVEETFKKMSHYIKENQHFCIASKGIQQDSCLFIADVLQKYIKTDQFAVISGPSFAKDIVSKYPIGLSLATNNSQTEKIIKDCLQNHYLKLRVTEDIIGVEICGSIKNVIAIAAGILDGLGANESTKAMFITESLHDVKDLIRALGGNKDTILSFAGFGDLLLTCTSIKSRNYSFGQLIGNNASLETIELYKKTHTIEGLYTLKSIYKLINNNHVDMPIIDLVFDIIYNNKSSKELLSFLINKQ